MTSYDVASTNHQSLLMGSPLRALLAGVLAAVLNAKVWWCALNR
jgi:hypothetical protein